ncbi:MAG: alpha/beta hydrolase [Kiritimatiellia bacterium]
MKRFSSKRLIRWLQLPLLFYVLASIAGCAVINSALYPVPRPSYTESDVDRWITAADGTRIAAMWLPNPAARHTLLFSHGNGEDLGHNMGFFQELHDEGFAVYAYDYRGYGRSAGKPTEKGTALDIRAAWDDLTGPLGVKPEDIILHGRSLGGGVTLLLARDVRPAAVILQSTFTSAFRVVTRIGILPFDRYSSIRNIRKLTCPVLLMHGEKDDIIPVAHGRTLFARAPEPKRLVIVAGAAHNDFELVMGRDYLRIIRQFSQDVAAGNLKGSEESRLVPR